MAYHIIGLDEGSCAVKAVILERSFRGYELKGTRIVPVPQDGSGPPSAEAVRAAMAQLVEEFDPGSVGYVTAASGSRVSTWFLQLPFTDKRRIDQALPFELENYVPFDLDDMVLDYESVRVGEEETRVVAALARRSDIAESLARLKSLRIDPEAIMLDAFALTYVPPGKEAGDRPVAIVDLGHTQTLVTVRVGGSPDFMRTIRLGGLDITRALMKAFGVGYYTAEAMKKELKAVPVAAEDLLALQAAAEFAEQEAVAAREAALAEALAGTYGAEGNTSEAHTGSARVDSQLESPWTAPPAARYGATAESSLEAESELEPGSFSRTVALATLEDEGEPGELDDDNLDMVKSLQESAGTTGVLSERPELEAPSEQAIRTVAWNAFAPLMREIRSVLVAYEASSKRDIGAVLLVGGGAQLPEVAERLSESLGVQVGRPARFGPEQVTLDAGEDQARYALPFALAYMGATEARFGDLNFRRGEFRYRRNYEALRGYLVGGAALAFIGLVVLTVMFFQRIGELNAQRDSLQTDIAERIKEGFPDIVVEPGKSNEKALALMLEQYTALQERGKLLGLGSEHRRTLDVLKEVSEALPARGELVIDLEDFQIEGDQLLLRGTTNTFEDVERIEKSLQASPQVQETKSEVNTKGDKKYFTFTITLKSLDQDSES